MTQLPVINFSLAWKNMKCNVLTVRQAVAKLSAMSTAAAEARGPPTLIGAPATPGSLIHLIRRNTRQRAGRRSRFMTITREIKG